MSDLPLAQLEQIATLARKYEAPETLLQFLEDRLPEDGEDSKPEGMWGKLVDRFRR